MMYVRPPHLISLSLRSRLLELRSPISMCLLPNPWVISPPSFVTAAGLLGSCLAVLLLQDTDETVQGLDNDGPAAACIGPLGAVLVSGAPVHAGREVQ